MTVHNIDNIDVFSLKSHISPILIREPQKIQTCPKQNPKLFKKKIDQKPIVQYLAGKKNREIGVAIYCQRGQMTVIH